MDLGPQPDEGRYSHLQDKGDFEKHIAALRFVVRRGTGCFWLPDSPKSTVRAFRHQPLAHGLVRSKSTR